MLRVWSLLSVSTLTVAGCAGTARVPSDGPTVELVVHNEGVASLTAFLHWEGFRPVRLGEIGGGGSETYLPPFRSGGLCVTALARGTIAFDVAVPEREPRECTRFIPVVRGEQLNVAFRRDGRVCYLQHDPDC